MSSSQADRFAAKWGVVEQFTDSSTGVSAALFRNGDEICIAIRGTQLEVGDLLADGILALGVSSRLNPQFIALQTKIDQWREQGGPLQGRSFTVSGHSLGGYLAAAVKETFSANVTQAYLFNAPGSGGLIGNIADLVSGLFSQPAPGANGVWNIKASEGISFVTGLGFQSSAGIPVQIEAAPGLGFGNHFIVPLADALSIQALYSTLVPSLTSAQLNALVDASGNPMTETLESALDALRRLLRGPSVTPTPIEDREAFYSNLYELIGSSEYATLVGVSGTQLTLLAGTPASTVASMAGTGDAQGLAIRYAVKELNPFALTGANYAPFNAEGALNLYDATLQRSGLTARYLTDRTNFLERKLWFSTEDRNPVDPFATYNPEQPPSFINESTSAFFLDAASGYDIRLGALFPSTHIYAFGSEGIDVLTGQSLDDHLYGGGGTDFLTGGQGEADYMEGGTGRDSYRFATGDGADTLLDADGKAVVTRNGKVMRVGLNVSDGVWAFGGATFTRVNDGQDLEIAFADLQTDKITVKDFDFSKAALDGYLGIRLIDAPAVPTFTAPSTPQTTREVIGDFEPAQNTGTFNSLFAPGFPEDYRPDFGATPVGSYVVLEVFRDPDDNHPTAYEVQYTTLDDLDNVVTTGSPMPGRPDTLKDSSGNDKILAGEGDNTITATRGGEDWIVTGAGNDTVTDSGGNNLIDTGAGADNIFTYGAGDDWILAGAGNDIVNDVAGNNRIEAGADNDVVNTGAGNDLILGGGGDDQIGDEGGANLIDAGAGRDIVVAGVDADWVEGGADGDILDGNEGNDTLFADSSNGQTLSVAQAITAGEAGAQAPGPWDLLSGNQGDDILIGAAGVDYLAGGEGRDVLAGGAGDDTIYGDQTVAGYTLGWSVERTPNISSTSATFTVTRSAGFTAFESPGSADTIYGGAGKDWIFAGAGDDYVEGGDSQDDANIDDDVVLGEGGSDILVGGSGKDYMDGDSAQSNDDGSWGEDYLDGGAGDDTLFGSKGNDILIGGAGDDKLLGGEDDDLLYGGAGIDVLQGGTGKDTYVYYRGDGVDVVVDPDIATDSQYRSALALGPGITKEQVKFHLGSLVVDLGEGDAIHFEGFDSADPVSTPVLDSIQFADGDFMTYDDILAQGFDIDGTEDVDVLFGTPYTDRIDAKGGDDTVMGRAGDDAILGGAGDDWVEGAAGNDDIDGGEGSDQLAGYLGDDVLAGGSGDDALAGGDGNDALQGGDGADSLVGDDGDDSLEGGVGDDLLIGNAGSDTYVFTAGDGADLIDEQAFIAQGLADVEGTDVVRFDAAVTPGQVTLSRGANGDLTIRYGATDSVTIAGQYAGAAQSIERIEFDDGAVIDKAALDAVATAPIEGTAGDDFLSGTPGNDTLAGAAGADSYAVYLGMGRDTLVDGSPSAAEVGTLQLAAGLSLDSLKARRVGDDLAVDIRGTNDGVLIQGYFDAVAPTQDWQIVEDGGAVTDIQDLIDRPDPYADNIALGAREDFRQALLSAWATETVSSALPTHAMVFEGWSQTTFRFYGDGILQPFTIVNPPVTTFNVNGYGIRSGNSFASAPLSHHSISVLATSQESDDANITAQSQAGSETDYLTYGVNTGPVIHGYGAQSQSSTSTYPSGTGGLNTIVSRSIQGWAPVTLTPGSGSGFPATLTIQEISETRNIEDITGGESANTIVGATVPGHIAMIDAGGGNDVVFAGPNDFAYGNDGDDSIVGGSLVYGGNGVDTLDGGATQYGGAGNDSLRGGAFMAGGSGDDRMTGIAGATTFYLDPSEVGADVVEDLAGVEIDQLVASFYDVLGIVAAGEDDGGLWSVTGQTLDSVRGLYWYEEGYRDYESQADARLGPNGEETAFFYLSLDDLRADLAAVGAPYLPDDIHYLLPLEDLRANDYEALERFYESGLIEKDTVSFGPGVAAGDLALTWSQVDVQDPLGGPDAPHVALDVSWGASSSVGVAIPRAFDPIGTGVEQFQFADGTVLSMAQMIALAPPAPSFDPAIPVVGSDGANVVDGGRGSHRYQYEAAKTGIDQLADSGIGTLPYLNDYYAGQGLENWEQRPEYTNAGRYRIYRDLRSGGYDYFNTFEEAADAAAADRNQPVQFVAPATVVAPLVSRADTATLDQLYDEGLLDRDVVSFGAGLGLEDLDISLTLFGRTADAHPEQPWYGGGTLSVRWNGGTAGFDAKVPNANYGFAGTNFVLDGSDGYRLGEGIEAIEFADGSSYSLEAFLQNATLNLIYGYQFLRGSDYQLVEGDYTGVDFAPDIAPSDLYAFRSGADLLFGVIADSALGRIADWYASPSTIPDWEFRFDDGTVLDADAVTRLGLTQNGDSSSNFLFADPDFSSALIGHGGSDYLVGGSGNDLLDGGSENDTLSGEGGNDIYVFGAGYGVDFVNENVEGAVGGSDTLRFDDSVTVGDVSVAQDFDMLIVSLGGDGDAVQLSGWFNEPGGSVETLQFSDGTTWDAAAVEALLPVAAATAGDDQVLGRTGADALNGLEGNDEIHGFAGNDTLAGGPGDDFLVGGNGDDTYEFRPGDGADIVVDRSGENVLRFGVGIDAPSVRVTRDESTLYVLPGGADDRVGLLDWFSDEPPPISQVQFNDGTSWSTAELAARVSLVPATEQDDILWGSAGADVVDALGGDDQIYGNAGGDILRGGAGDDSFSEVLDGANLLEGGEGSDYFYQEGRSIVVGGTGDDWADVYGPDSVVAFNPGDGADTVYVKDAFTLSIGGGIGAQDLSLSLDEGDIVLAVGSADSVRLSRQSEPDPQAWPQITLQLFGSVHTYDFNAVIDEFYAAIAADPSLTEFGLGDVLPGHLIASSETDAFGGAIAHQYGTLGTMGGLTNAQIFSVLQDQNFGAAPQAIAVSGGHSAPVVSAADSDLLLDDSVLASTLFSVFDEDGQSATQYEFWDDVAGGGHFVVNGMEQGAASSIPVSAADLANTQYVAGTTPGTERVWVRANDGEAWSAWKSWNMTSALHIPDAAPDATPTGATQTVLLDESVAVASLFSVADADGDPAVRYEFWDSTAGSGYFAVNGVEQLVNVAIVVAAQDLANTTFVGAAQAGSDQVWVRATDGQSFGAWRSWTMNSWPHASNAAPVADAPDGAVLRDQAVSAQSLVSVTDADGDPIAQYEFWDDTSGGGYFALGGVAQTNNPLPVTAAQLSDLEYVGGANPGTEQVWVRASDGLQWGAWESWNMTTALHIPNSAPEATPTAATQTVLLGQAVDASALISVADADGDSIATYEFWDSSSGGGHFSVSGVEQGVNVSITVSAADLASAQFVGAAAAGLDTVWVRATDGQTFGAWTSWTMNSWPHASNAAPVADAANATILTGEVLGAASLFSVSDADGDDAARYEFWDDVNGGGYWRVNGVQQAAAAAIAVNATDLAGTDYVGGANPGSEQVWVRANDGLEWGAWKPWTMTTALHVPNAAPEVTASSSTVLLDQAVAADSLFSVTDADSDTITQYEFWDSTAGNGHFTVDGVEQGVNVAIGVTAAQLADTEFSGGSSTGSDTVWVRASDGMAWSAWKSWTMNSWPHLTNAAPVVTASSAGILRNEALPASMFFGVSDTDGDAMASYEFWDDVNGGGHFEVNGVQQAAAQSIAISAADLANTTYVGGANPGTEQVWARANDGMAWGAWKNWLMSTEGGMVRGGAGPDTLNGEAGPTVLEGGAGNDVLTDTDGNNVFSGGEGDDAMTGGDGSDLFAGGAGNDTIDTGAGNNVIAYNAGGGIDTVFAAAGAANTLSFGGGIGYDDLSLSKDGSDLVVSAGENDRVVLKDWYAGSNSVLDLQIILDATQEFDANSSDPLYNKKVQTFDFAGLVAEFDNALAQSPGLTSWAVTNALLAFHLSGADDAAIGGDLAYWYGKNNGFTGMSLAAAQQAIGAPGFGADAQTLHPFNGLQEGYVKLA
jgi:Ca2+-binding RTX toxin-like protein